MGGRQRREVPLGLAEARDRFQVWRRRREPRSRIPEPLWALAVKLAAAHGVHRTASTLKLDYYSLKRRVESAEYREDAKAPAFIELPSAVAGGRECVIEFEDGRGVSLRVHLRGYDATDVVAIARSFRDAQ
jgi:hypothetical protein